jgi:N-acetylglucosaminyl-diphospho-decaprenol L-rhamnosyltransferase
VRISVLIVTWNNESSIETCLRSVTRQARSTDEVLVWDNASSDRTADIVARHPGVALVRAQENRGFAHGVNRLAELASGSALLLLNPDTELRPDALAMLEQTAEAHSGAIVGGRLLSSSGSPQPASARPFPTALGLARWLVTRRPVRWEMPTSTTAVDAVSGAMMLVPRELWSAVGGLDEGYPHAGEDLAICLAAWRHGASVVFSPGASAIHEHEASVVQAPAAIDVLRWLGSVRFTLEHEGRTAAVLLRIALCFYSAAVLVAARLGADRSRRSVERARLLWRWAMLGRTPLLPQRAVGAG